MKDYGIVQGSKEQAKPLIVGKDTVYVHTDIKETTDEYGNVMYQYHEVQYDKDEFIEIIVKKTNENGQEIAIMEEAMCDNYTEQSTTNTEVEEALIEIYELIEGGI